VSLPAAAGPGAGPAATAALRIGVLTDLHLCPPGTADGRWISTERLGASRELTRRGLSLVYEHQPDLVVLLGDLTHQGDPDEIDRLLNDLTGAPAPVIALTGNHDVNQSATVLADRLATRSPRARTGRQARSARLAGERIGGVLVAGGNLHRTGQGWDCALDALPSPAAWPAGQLIVWLAHHPVISLRSTFGRLGLPYAGDLVGHHHVLGALRAHDGPAVALTGHLHVRAHAIAGNVLQLSHAAVVEHPHEVSIVEIAQAQRAVTVTRHALAIPGVPPPADPGPPLAVPGPASATWRWQAGHWRAAGTATETDSYGARAADP
jgi:3',5'-cyclic-AMP phosphodiesterase